MAEHPELAEPESGHDPGTGGMAGPAAVAS
jgi:hypothetical protein